MEFVQTYIFWLILVMFQFFIASTVTLKAHHNDENSLLEAVINEVEAIKFRFEEEISALKSEMEALKLENGQLKQQFYDFKSKSLHELDNFLSFTAVTSVDLSYAPGDVVIFDRALRNYGNGYNPGTGVFTCDVSGFYLWFVNLYVAEDTSMSAEIFIENQEGGVMPELVSPKSGTDNGPTLGVSYCEAGSGVWVQVTELGGRPVDSDRFRSNSFTGVLLSIV